MIIRILLSCLMGIASLAAQGEVLTYDYRVDDFDNGLRLVTIPTEFPGSVSIHIVVSTGSRNEVEEGKSGFAHFFEHMMFRGTKTMTSEQQAALFKAAGADRNAYTTADYTNYHTTVPTEELEVVMRLEADRFQNLEYSEKAFRTEAMAVYGEYNKNSSNPISKMFEVLQNTAFDQHTYKHTTMGFLRDIRAMPRQFDYSREFFERFYKPEYTTIVVVGDVTPDAVNSLVKTYWGGWQRGSYVSDIPEEPEQDGPRTCHIPWPAPTQPWVAVTFKGPAFSTSDPAMPTLDVISALNFSPNSEIYKKLFVRERKVDQFFAYFPDHTDPYLVMILARVREASDWGYVRDEILATCERIKSEPASADRLAAVKSNLRYSFVGGLDSSDSIASAVAGYIARTRDPESINQVYRMYEAVTPAAIQAVARQYFVADSRTIATLSDEPLPEMPEPTEGETGQASSGESSAGFPGLLQQSSSPLVSLRLVFPSGAADDPDGKAGLASITAQLLTSGATKQRPYEAIIEALYPMAASVGVQVDKEMTVFSGTVHRDNLEAYYTLFAEMLRQPAFDVEDLERVKANVVSGIDLGLRRTNDEELGKEVMFQKIFAGGHPYGHLNAGTIESVQSISVEDVRAFYEQHFRQGAAVGLAGGFPSEFGNQVAEDFGAKPISATEAVPAPAPIEASRMTIVQKSTLATGMHIGIPIDVTRSHPDWAALWLVRSFLGEHRSENSFLYQRLREIRGLNYGDYSYIEYFPNGGSQFHPPANVARRQQIFQIWLRPVPPNNAPFALKAAWYELDKLVKNGLTVEQFEGTRNYLDKFVSQLLRTQDRQIGYGLDSQFYGTGEFAGWVREELSKLTLDGVNRAIREHLRSDRLQFVVVTQDGAAFRDQILGDAPTGIDYQTKPAQEILDEDAVIEALRLGIDPSRVEIVPVEDVFVR